MELVANRVDLDANANAFLDAVHDRTLGQERAREMLGAGWVYYPFRYGEQLAFAPAKFVGYVQNSIEEYDQTKKIRHGGRARAAISKVLGYDARPSVELNLQLQNYCLQLGVPLQNKKHSFWIDKSVRRFVKNDRSAIRDIDPLEFGNDDPEYVKRMGGVYVRDQAVRNSVLDRAKGVCEYCGGPGFVAKSGRRFLEAHHVISLSEQGADKVTNVIALCPNDHRRAHFGEDWESLQAEFLKVLRKLNR